MKKSLFVQVLILASLIFINFGCSVEKRLHTKGFHVKRKGNVTLQKSNNQENDFDKAIVQIKEDKEFNKEKYELEYDEISASTNAEFISYSEEPKKVNFFDDDKPCDNLVLTNGEEISAVIEEIGEEKIKYRKCENQSGPLYSLSREKVFMIKYSNGQKELFNTESESKKENKDEVQETKVEKKEALPTQQSVKKDAVLSFLYGLLAAGTFILIILSFFGIISNPLWMFVTQSILGSLISVLAIIGSVRALNSIEKIGAKNIGNTVLSIIAFTFGVISALGILVLLILLLI